MNKAKVLWLQIHRYLALSVGAFIALISLTGSALVFQPQLDRLLNPQLARTAAGPLQVSADQAVASAVAQTGFPAQLLWMPEPGGKTFTIDAYDAATDRFRMVTVDGVSGQILADRVWGRTAMTFLMRLHATLLLGDGGVTLVSGLSLILLVSALSGLYLWWPRELLNRRAFLPRPMRTPFLMNFEVHRLLGLYLLPAILIIALTGVYFGLPQPFSAVVDWFSPVSPEREEPSAQAHPPRLERSRVSLQQVEAAVRETFPQSRIAFIRLPRAGMDNFEASVFAADEPASRSGLSTVQVDATSGAITRRAYSDLNTGDRFIALQLPLHAGVYFGLAGKIIASLAGVTIMVLYVTGLYVWWKRRARA